MAELFWVAGVFSTPSVPWYCAIAGGEEAGGEQESLDCSVDHLAEVKHAGRGCQAI